MSEDRPRFANRSLRALAEITELRATLARVEAALVLRAREDGYWWSDVGAALGITRQAAHQRHAAQDPLAARRRRRREQEQGRYHAPLEPPP